MTIPVDRTARCHNVRHRHLMRSGLLLSALLHLMVLFAFRSQIETLLSSFAAAGPRSGDSRAAPGGGKQIVNLRVAQAPAPVPEITMPRPIPIPSDEIVPEPEIVVNEAKPHLAYASILGIGRTSSSAGRGSGSGAGVEGGTGRGDGGLDLEGRLRMLPPSPRSLILPPSDRPSGVKAKKIDVLVFVNVEGAVVADSTRLDPGSGDPGFDAHLMEQAAGWTFTPARRGGQLVAAWFRYTVVF